MNQDTSDGHGKVLWKNVECGRARSCSPAGVNPVPEGRPTTG
jgi:hypothetical protein